MAQNSLVPPPHRRRKSGDADSSRSSKRLKQVPEEDYFAVSSVDCVLKLSQPQSIVDSHDCGVCGKSFPSYQALGGHKKSHRIKTVVAAVTDIQASNCTSCGFHHCSTCGEGYSTGQALGGHMRKHFVGGIILNAGRNSLDGGNGSATYSGRDGGSDLNTPPHSPGLDLTLKL